MTDTQARDVMAILARFERDPTVDWSTMTAEEVACRIADLIRFADSLTLMTALTGLTAAPFRKRVA